MKAVTRDMTERSAKVYGVAPLLRMTGKNVQNAMPQERIRIIVNVKCAMVLVGLILGHQFSLIC
jgi:hypothetical protein